MARRVRPITAANSRMLGLRARALFRALDAHNRGCLCERSSLRWQGNLGGMIARRERALWFTVQRFGALYRQNGIASEDAVGRLRRQLELALGHCACSASGAKVIDDATRWLRACQV